MEDYDKVIRKFANKFTHHHIFTRKSGLVSNFAGKSMAKFGAVVVDS